MGVPNSDDFSLQHVVNEVNPTTNDLQDCINDATTSFYDTQYFSAPATSLQEFRNYQDSGSTPDQDPYVTNSVGTYKWYRAIALNGDVSGNEDDFDNPGVNNFKRNWVLHNPTSSSVSIRLVLDDDTDYGFKGSCSTNVSGLNVVLQNEEANDGPNDIRDISSGTVTLSAGTTFNITFSALNRQVNSAFSIYFEYLDGAVWETLLKPDISV